jgi:hypothetical protein
LGHDLLLARLGNLLWPFRRLHLDPSLRECAGGELQRSQQCCDTEHV